jgi:hypothetical protein
MTKHSKHPVSTRGYKVFCDECKGQIYPLIVRHTSLNEIPSSTRTEYHYCTRCKIVWKPEIQWVKVAAKQLIVKRRALKHAA